MTADPSQSAAPPRPAVQPLPRRWQAVTGLTLGFALFGPLAGSGLMYLLMLSVAVLDDASANLITGLLMLPLVVVFGFVLGVLPAATTGLLYALTRPWLRPGWPHTVLAAACGAAVLLTACLMIDLSNGTPGIDLAAGRWRNLLTVAGLGATAAVISQRLCQAWIRTWRQVRHEHNRDD